MEREPLPDSTQFSFFNSAGYKNIIATASEKHHDFLRSLGATSTFGYKSPNLVEEIAAAAGGDEKVTLAMDCITTEDSLATIAKFISALGTLAILLPFKMGSVLTVKSTEQMLLDIPQDRNPLPKGTKVIRVRALLYQKQELLPKILPSLLESGAITPNRVRLMDQGSFEERVAMGLDLLRNNRVSAEKVVVKVST